MQTENSDKLDRMSSYIVYCDLRRQIVTHEYANTKNFFEFRFKIVCVVSVNMVKINEHHLVVVALVLYNLIYYNVLQIFFLDDLCKLT